MWAICARVTLLFVVFAQQCLAVQNPKQQDKEELIRFLEMQKTHCLNRKNSTVKPSDGLFCDMAWDNIMCWNHTLAGTTVVVSCPSYIHGFSAAGNVTRTCLANGTWAPPPSDAKNYASGWTNYTACSLNFKPSLEELPAIITEHLPRINVVSKIGYSISLAILVLAITIMLFFKRLYCQRNIIHINLFFAVAFRALICLLRDSLLVQNLGLPHDVIMRPNGSITFTEGPHWECKLLFTLFHLAICASYMWIFVEGLYLHTLIFFAVFSQKTIFKWYIVIGWVTPVLYVFPWVIIRTLKHDERCWNTDEKGYYWIINGPIVTTICVNFFFFLNIIRVLFTKLRAMNSNDPQRYRKLAKSTLVLIPLFGVYYIFFIVIGNSSHKHPVLEVVLIYIETLLNSFQGTVVAFLFCFMNGEVQSEIKKKWQRHMLRRYSTVSARSSRAMSTTTSFWLRERTSISQEADNSRRGSTRFPAVDSSVSLKSMVSSLGSGRDGEPEARRFESMRCNSSPTLKYSPYVIKEEEDDKCDHNGHAVLPLETVEEYANGIPHEETPMLKAQNGYIL